MSITIRASYQNGVLQPEHPLPLDENEQVTIVVTRVGSRIREAAEQYRISVSPEVIRAAAEDPELRFGAGE